MMKAITLLVAATSFLGGMQAASAQEAKKYWNDHTLLLSYRLPPPPPGCKPIYIDLDGDRSSPRPQAEYIVVCPDEAAKVHPREISLRFLATVLSVQRPERPGFRKR